jgi:predicted SprT family Zn-dependent metalloprotease
MNLEAAASLAKSLISTHLSNEWSFSWNRRKSSFGLCNYKKRQIQLSIHLVPLESAESVKATILHEIAHALTPGHKHDAVWRNVAIRLGLKNPKSAKQSEQPEKIQYKWAITFNGEVVKTYHRKPNESTIKQLPFMSVKGQPHSKGCLVLERIG